MPSTQPPKGFKWSALTDLARLESGHTPSRSHPEYWGGSIPWIGIKDARAHDGQRIEETNETTNDLGIQNSSARVLPKNTVCLSRTASVGYVVVMGRPMATSQDFVNWVCSKDLDPNFLKYLFVAEDEDLLRFASGSVHQTIYFPEAKAFHICHPPLAEQQRIVGLLDAAFEGIATAKANAEKNLQNARALFESHLQSVFSQRGAAWDRVSLEELLERGWIEGHLDGNHGGDYPKKEEFIREGVPYISANCLDDEERIDMSRAKYLSPARAAKLRKGIAKDNDVIFAHNATVGPVAILKTSEEKVNLGTSLTYYRCNQKHILPEYLAHYMRSFGFKTQYMSVMRQSTRNQVPITKQREFFHVIPPSDEQRAIVGQLDGLLENGQRLATLYTRKLAALEALKKSLLHQAFTGGL